MPQSKAEDQGREATSSAVQELNASRDLLNSAKSRWHSVEIAGAVVLSLLGLSAYLHHLAPSPTPSLLFPYLAAASVYFATCVWILSDGYFTRRTAGVRSGAARTALLIFLVVAVFLVLFGLAGKSGESAIQKVNCYLFGGFCEAPPLGLADSLSMPFNYVASAGNAIALSTLAYLTLRCREVTLEAVSSDSIRSVGKLTRTLSRLHVLASALLVTSTLTLFLLFATSDQIELPGKQATLNASVQPPASITLNCKPNVDQTTNCVVLINGIKPPESRTSSAAVMAVVAGIAFTGALFMIFMTASMAVDEHVDELLEVAMADGENKINAKVWREESGFPEASATDRALQALAFLAPALTGAVTLAIGK